MDLNELTRIVSQVELGGPFDDKWYEVGLLAETNAVEGTDDPLFFIQVRYMEPDIYTGEMAEQHARIWVVESTASESQVVQICFGAALASSEHQTREFFTYNGKRTYGPHMNVADLEQVAR